MKKTCCDFDIGFDKMMSSAIEHEKLMEQKKEIPAKLQQRINESFDWVNHLSDEDYSRLIH